MSLLLKAIMGMSDLYMWIDPAKSGVVFGTVLVCLLALNGYSLISVLAYTSLFLLFSVVGVRLYVYVMNTFLKKNVADPIQKIEALELKVSEEQLQQLASCSTGKVNLILVESRRLFLVENTLDSVKFGLVLWLLTYLGAYFNFLTLAIVFWVGLFTVPKVYVNNKTQIDPILEQIKVKLAELQAKVEAIFPAKKVEKKEE